MGSTDGLVNPIDPAFVGRMDADFVAYYNKYMGIVPPTHAIDFADVRANPQKYAYPWCRDFAGLPCVRDIEIASGDGHKFAARVYQPDAAQFGPGPYPAHVNLHGTSPCGGRLLRGTLLTTVFCRGWLLLRGPDQRRQLVHEAAEPRRPRGRGCGLPLDTR